MLCLGGARVIDDAAVAATVVGNMPWKSCTVARPPRAPGAGQLLMKGDFFLVAASYRQDASQGCLLALSPDEGDFSQTPRTRFAHKLPSTS